MQTVTRTLEVPIDSAESARLAAPLSTRLEVCHDLSSEGWTPKMDVLRACVHAVEGTACTVVSMIRPQLTGGSRELNVAAFTASPRLLDACEREIHASADAGAHSVAFGLLTSEGQVDMDATGALCQVARSRGLVIAFLRTFDLLIDRERGVRDLHALGFTRFITAGVRGWDASVAPLAARVEVLRRDLEVAQREAARSDRAALEVVPAGGVRASNAIEWLRVTPHLHASCRRDGRFALDELTALRRAMD